MKENSFNIKKNVLSKSNDNIIVIKRKEEDSKVFKNENTFQTQNNNLIKFISNLQKFSFSSAFDYQGAKSFLKSKEKALGKIVIDENILSHQNDINKIIKNNEDEEEKPKNRKRKETHTDISPLPVKNKYQSKIEDEKKEISPKNKVRKNQSRKEINSFKILKNKYEEKIMNDIGLKMPKISSKFCSQIELKMFNDKNLNRIKPIKIPKQKNTHNNLKLPEFNLNNGNNSIRSDSSLMQLVSEINKV